MNIHPFSTGHVKITENWRVGRGKSTPARLLNALADPHLTDWLPINCTLIEHPDGLILVDTGISMDTIRPVWFPPHMRLVQRAARFQLEPEQEIGPLMHARGFDPADVRTVVLTHLHQDHDGGIHYFPDAEFIVARTEWDAATGLAGRMAGYLNHRWPSGFTPTVIDFNDAPYGPFEASNRLADNVILVPTPGHSAGHLSVIVEEGDHAVFIAGDTSYTQDLLLQTSLDGVAGDPAAYTTTQRIIQAFAEAVPTVYLPTHDPDADHRLVQREVIPMTRHVPSHMAATV